MNFDDLIPGNKGLSFDDLVPKKDPKIGQPEELSFAEKYLAPVLEKIGVGDQGMAGKLGVSRGGAVGRVAMGLADPGVAVVQMGANAIGQGDAVNKRIQDVEGQYQEARKGAGSEGFDPLRAIGSAVITAPIPAAGGVRGAMGVMKAAGLGGALGLLDPVKDGGENFLIDKAKQFGTGAAVGGVLSPLMSALARVVSPKASVNPDVKLLRDEGVSPTVGQTLGGWANTLEQKATSLPILGDRISAMRRKAVEEFDNAAINRAVAPVGQKVSGAGHEAVAEAGDILSGEYQKALGSVNHVNFDTPAFNANLGQLQQMATGLSEPMQRKFEKTLEQVVLRKMSPNGSILGADLKAVDSELGQIVSRYNHSSVASEQELGDAVKQLKSLLTQEVGAANPQVAAALKRADTGWANLVRVEGAAKRGVNSDGIFTPGQLNMAVRSSDRSVRGRATARGEALLQDLGNAGQNVLGNTYPDSGTAGRLLAGVGGLATGMIHPAIPAGLALGAGAYTPPVQNVLNYLISRRPAEAPAVANYLRRLMAPAIVAGVPVAQEFR